VTVDIFKKPIISLKTDTALICDSRYL